MADSNHHAFVVPVVLEPHPDADRLSVVNVNAYTCVVATADWQGVTKAVYIQPDTVVPDTEEFAFLKRNNSARAELERGIAAGLSLDDSLIRLRHIEDGEKANTKNLRITARRLRGVQSFGMLWPLPEDSPLQVGDDAWDVMGLTRYEPPLPADAGGEADTAPLIPWLHEYDVENYYNWPTVLQEGEEVVATEKLDGANSRFVYAPDRQTGEYRQFVGGRTEWKRDSPTNLWWRAFRAHPWIGEFCKAHPDWTVYGETFGNVQKLKYGVKPNQPNKIRMFDVLAVNAFLDYAEFETLFTPEQRVPVIYRGPWEVEKFKALSLGNSTFADHLREGIVVCPIKERYDRALGRVKLKLVSFDLLSKGK
jgi:RNA ligase (TIGR02306 family)